jgi:serine/threonine protein kinase
MGSFLAQPLLTPETVAPTSSSRFYPGQLIANRFLVVRFIARGGMGEVYEAKDQFLQDAEVALKIIRPEIASDAASSSRFVQEVILARRVVHPHLCPIYEIYYCDQPAPSFLFLTMKLLPGETLDERLRTATKPGAGEGAEICVQLIAGVAALHSAGIIHRDLKPNNVMLERTGERVNVSIMDFGLARLHQAESTFLGSGMIVPRAWPSGVVSPARCRYPRLPPRDHYAIFWPSPGWLGHAWAQVGATLAGWELWLTESNLASEFSLFDFCKVKARSFSRDCDPTEQVLVPVSLEDGLARPFRLAVIFHARHPSSRIRYSA